MGLYLYSSGASRQQISILNHLHLSVSYQTLAGSGSKKHTRAVGVTSSSSEEFVPKDVMGTLEKLLLNTRKQVRSVASLVPLLVVYDNINMMWKVGEQILGRTGKR
jgi:hypothetical protein